METSFEDKCNILADLWLNYKDDETFKDFISYNDIGLPFAFFIAEDFGTPHEKGKAFINETFNLFLAAMGIEEDTGFESLDDILMGME